MKQLKPKIRNELSRELYSSLQSEAVCVSGLPLFLVEHLVEDRTSVMVGERVVSTIRIQVLRNSRCTAKRRFTP